MYTHAHADSIWIAPVPKKKSSRVLKTDIPPSRVERERERMAKKLKGDDGHDHDDDDDADTSATVDVRNVKVVQD